jgi:ketosteroid isomerase-like protein|nr:nuclear transport factor 2 family protein [Kofleriaceae bacterium]
MRSWLAALAIGTVAAMAATAAAGGDDATTAKLVADLITQSDIAGIKPPMFTLDDGVLNQPGSAAGLGEMGYIVTEPLASTRGASSDGTVVWFAQDLAEKPMCGTGDCAKAWRDAAKAVAYHYTVLLDRGQPLYLHLGRTLKSSAAKAGTGSAPSAIANTTAHDFEATFTASLADPKQFAAAVSDRNDAVLLGTDSGERYVGSAAIKKTLVAWGLAMTVRDGIASGIADNKTIAWVGANVDGKAKGDSKPTAYRLTIIYEKVGGAWRAVVIHFS